MSLEKLFGEYYREDQEVSTKDAHSFTKGNNNQRSLRKKIINLPVLAVSAFLLLALIIKSGNFHQTVQIHLPKKVYASSEGVTFLLAQSDPKKLQATVTSENGTQQSANVSIEKEGDKTRITVTPPNNFIPGKSVISVVDTASNTTYRQDFSWGVLAVNTNKSVYTPNEHAKLSLAVLDEKGMMVCDADVTLQITNSTLHIDDTLSTKNGTIGINPECKVKDYTEKPDYEAVYRVGGVGAYEMKLTARTKNGTYSITDSFEVKESVPFAVERTSATRIYPVYSYPVVITVTANQDFDGDIVERVPYAFSIKPSNKSALSYQEGAVHKESASAYWYKEIVWKTSMKKGEKKTLAYTYKSPEESPYFFTLGPLRFEEKGKQRFAEARRWQIAVDVVTTAVEQQINITDQVSSSTTETSAPSDNSLGVVKYAAGNYSNPTTSFESVVKQTRGGTLRNSSGYMNAIYCLSATDCKTVYVDTTSQSLRFRDCDDATCTTGTTTTIEGKDCVISGCYVLRAITNGVADQTLSLYCVATDDCKVLYHVYSESGTTVNDLYFADCDNATCTVGTTSIVDGRSGCTLTGCHATDTVNSAASLDCTGGSSDCKIVYRDGTDSALYFADCDNSTCTSGTIQLVDGGTSCPLTGCNASDNLPSQAVALDCSAGVTDCKIAYDNATKTALYFADCDSATCGTGTVTLLDGFTSCVLTGCNSGDAIPSSSGLINMDCPSAIDCKIVYQNGTKTAIYLADCDDATCGSGTTTIIDGTAGCTLTGCASGNNAATADIDCSPGAADCKIVFVDVTVSALKFVDCDNATCSTGTISPVDGTTSCGLTGCSTSATISDNESIYCISATDCKLSYHNAGTTDAAYFGDCDSATCNSGTATRLDGTGWGNHSVGERESLACPSSGNCKMVFNDSVDTSLRFRDCDDATCSTGTTVFLDGTAGCLATGCNTGDDTGEQVAMDCPSSNDCKIVYYNTTKTALYFIDCDSETCNKSTTTLLDGSASCVLTGCNSSDSVGFATAGDPHDNEIFCISGTDCKIAYYNASKTALYFADCNNATCSSGTAQLVDGFTSCPLTGCNSGDQVVYLYSLDLYCVATDDCKIAYYNDTKSATYFADCDSATCGAGNISIIDGFTSCVITGCTSGDITGRNITIDCIGGSTDCKLAYGDATLTQLDFVDCDTSACGSGTLQMVDGNTGCPLTGCSTGGNPTADGLDMDCLSATDCKITYHESNGSSIRLTDCDSATCNSGTVTNVDGASGCTLTGCDTGGDVGNGTGDTSIDCLSATDCKLLYWRSQTALVPALGDCDNATCTSGTATNMDSKDTEYSWVGLYDTSGTMVADGIVESATTSGYVRQRSTNTITPADGNYTVRAFSSDDTDVASILAANRIIVAQSAGGGVTNSQTQVELGNNETTTGTSYTQLAAPKIYLFDSNNFAGTVTASFEATLKGSAGGVTATAALSTSSSCASTVSGSDVAVTGTTWTLTRSSSLTLSDNTEYWVCIKTSSGTASIASAKLLIDQANGAGLDKMQMVQQMVNTSVTDADTTYTNQNYLTRIVKGNFAGPTVSYYFEGTMKTTAGTGYANLYNTTSSASVTGGEITTAGGSYSRVRSSDLASALASDAEYDTQVKNSATNTTSVANSWIIVSLGAATPTPTFTPTPTPGSGSPDTTFKGSMRLKGNLRFL